MSDSTETVCPSWTAEEVEELRNVLLNGEVAAVDTAIFGKRFSEIVIRAGEARDRRIAEEGRMPGASPFALDASPPARRSLKFFESAGS